MSQEKVEQLKALFPEALNAAGRIDLSRLRAVLGNVVDTEREEVWHLIAASAQCIVWHADMEDQGEPTLHWHIKVVNEEAAQRFFPVEVPPGRTYAHAWGRSRLPEDKARMDVYGEGEARAGRSYRQEYRCRRADGAIRWFSEEVFVQTLSPGRWRAVGVSTDITERKAVEEEKMRLLQQVADAAIKQRRFLRDVLFSVTEGRLCLCSEPADLPAELPLIGEPLALSPPALSSLRRRVEGAAAANCLPEVRWQDLTLAAGEAAMNAIRHGGGGEARVCGDGQKTVQVWIQDQGAGIAMEQLPRATLEPGYSSAGTMGHGFWIMLKTCDRIYLLTGPTGTTLVLEQDRDEPPPSWLRVAETMGLSLDGQPVF